MGSKTSRIRDAQGCGCARGARAGLLLPSSEGSRISRRPHASRTIGAVPLAPASTVSPRAWEKQPRRPCGGGEKPPSRKRTDPNNSSRETAGGVEVIKRKAGAFVQEAGNATQADKQQAK